MQTAFLLFRMATVSLILAAELGYGQSTNEPSDGKQTPIRLWPAGAPQAQGSADSDIPQLIPFIPARPRTTTGILVIPGGGYTGLSLPTEGYEIAHFLNAAGIPAFVLKYRIAPQYRYPVQFEDGQRALRYLRANSARFNIHLVGVAGFSAGGHLASMLGTTFDSGDANAADPVDRMPSRPDFLILGYPVINTQGFAAAGSLRNIDPDRTHPVNITTSNVVANPAIDPKLVELLATDLRVNKDTPLTFLVCADDDRSVFPENSVKFYMALRQAGVPAELHIYEHGRHGFGLAAWDPVDSTWTAHMLDWLRINDLLPALAK